MSDFQRKNGRVQDLESYLESYLEWDLEWDLEFLVAGPAGRAGSSPYIAKAGKIFQPTHPHTHTPHLIDFINPDCHLLGKNILREVKLISFRRLRVKTKK